MIKKENIYINEVTGKKVEIKTNNFGDVIVNMVEPIIIDNDGHDIFDDDEYYLVHNETFEITKERVIGSINDYRKINYKIFKFEKNAEIYKHENKKIFSRKDIEDIYEEMDRILDLSDIEINNLERLLNEYKNK